MPSFRTQDATFWSAICDLWELLMPQMDIKVYHFKSLNVFWVI